MNNEEGKINNFHQNDKIIKNWIMEVLQVFPELTEIGIDTNHLLNFVNSAITCKYDNTSEIARFPQYLTNLLEFAKSKKNNESSVVYLNAIEKMKIHHSAIFSTSLIRLFSRSSSLVIFFDEIEDTRICIATITEEQILHLLQKV